MVRSSIPALAMGTLSLYVGIYYFILYARRRNEHESLTFALTCLSVAFYDVCCAGLYNAVSFAQGIKWQRGQFLSISLIATAFIWFIKDFTGGRTGPAERLATLFYACMFLLVMTVANGWTLTPARPSVKNIVIGESVTLTYHEVEPGALLLLMELVSAVLFIYLIYRLVRYQRRAPQEKILPIILSFILFFFAVINDSLVGAGAYGFPYVAEYTFMCIVLAMGYALQDRFITIHKEVEALNASLEKRVEERTRELSVAGENLKREIAERKRKEAEIIAYTRKLRASNQELVDFAHIASHDLQEPLRKVTAFGDRLAARAGDALDDRARDYLARMQNAAGRMSGLLEGLLGYARVTTKGSSFKTVDMDKVTSNVLNDLEVRINETGGRVDTEPLGTVQADQLQMRQLVQNLVGNALKYHKPDVPPAVKMAARVTDDGAWYELTVADNGIGIADEDKERAFGIFQRLVGKSEYEGTGVGLAICKKIAERHGGTISLQGTLGVGTTFTVRLPAAVKPVTGT